jgi:hypothetical protein
LSSAPIYQTGTFTKKEINVKENTTAPKRDRRRQKALLGMIVVGSIIGFLIYFGQVAVIYILSTLSLIALLLAVGFSDLEKIGTQEKTLVPNEIENEIRSGTKVQKAEI